MDILLVYLRSKQPLVTHGRSGVTIKEDCMKTVGCVPVLTEFDRSSCVTGNVDRGSVGVVFK